MSDGNEFKSHVYCDKIITDKDAEIAALRAEVDQYRATVDSLVGGLFPDHGIPKATAAEACKELVAIVQHGAKEQVRLEARVAVLTTALKPFAVVGTHLIRQMPDDDWIEPRGLLVGDFRRAAAALSVQP